MNASAASVLRRCCTGSADAIGCWNVESVACRNTIVLGLSGLGVERGEASVSVVRVVNAENNRHSTRYHHKNCV